VGEQKRKLDARAILAKFPSKTTRHVESLCTNCGIVIDASTIVGIERSPQPGNIGICMKCSHVMAYDENIKLRDLTDEEVIAIAGDKNILLYIKSIDFTKRAWELKHGKGSWDKRKEDGPIPDHS
jgi:hypothetical protein